MILGEYLRKMYSIIKLFKDSLMIILQVPVRVCARIGTVSEQRPGLCLQSSLLNAVETQERQPE